MIPSILKQRYNMKVKVIIEKDENGFGCFAENLKSTIIGEGKSVDEAKEDFLNSVEEVKASYLENGGELPSELKDLEFEYKYDLASFFNEFDFINVSKLAKRIGINASLMRQYKSCDAYISETQAKKIESAIRGIGRELSSVSL